MKLVIYRGTNQIGGSCVEVQSGSDRVLLDLGLPLPDDCPGGKDGPPPEGQSQTALIESGLLPHIAGVYRDDQPEVKAVIMSHVHPDHIGLGQYVHGDIPVYATAGTWALMDVMQVFKPQTLVISNRRTLPKNQPLHFGALTVTAYATDHSAPDAVALLVEEGAKRVLYSGDLRAHGRKAHLWQHLIKELVGSVDVLILEGTTIGRPAGAALTEHALETKLTRILQQQQSLALVFCASQNVDRLVSIHNVAKQLNKLMVIDLYTAYTLHALRELAPHLPQWDSPEIRVVQWKYQQVLLENAGQGAFVEKTAKRRIGWQGLQSQPRETILLMRTNRRLLALEEKFGAEVARMPVIWSMWDGYWQDDVYVRPLCERHGIERITLHASGHASWPELVSLVHALRPKLVVPIHTREPVAYARDLPHVRVLRDGEVLEL